MVKPPQEKHYVHIHRSSRQVRPILSGIVFLLAANLVAKGVLGLSAFNTPHVTSPNLQGSLYLNFGQNGHGTHQPQILPYQSEFWRPMQITTPKPVQPISQQQIINIHDTGFADSAPGENYQDEHEQPRQQIIIEKGADTFLTTKENQYIINKYGSHKRESQKDKIKREAKKDKNGNVGSLPELLFFKAKNGQLINQLANLKKEIHKKESQKEVKEPVTEMVGDATIPSDVEIFDRNVTDADVDEFTTIGRQVQTTTLAPTTTPTTTTTTTTTTPAPPPTTMPPGMNMTSNSTGYNYTVNGYGPYTGNENVSITTMSPSLQNMTMTNATTIGNMTGNGTTPFPGYYYYPAGDYGPSNGNEHISITYGPPIHHEHFNQQEFYEEPHDNKPFFSSPEDHFLNQQTQEHEYGNIYDKNQNYDNFDPNFNKFFEQQNTNYEHNQFPDTQKYNDIVHKFYNKYDYHYPAFYNNVVGK